jgi:surface protein
MDAVRNEDGLILSPYLKPENVKKDVILLGVKGAYEGKAYDKYTGPVNVTPTIEDQVLNTSGKINDSDITVALAETDKANIKAENIRKNVTILGTTGTLEEGVKPTAQTVLITVPDPIPATTGTTDSNNFSDMLTEIDFSNADFHSTNNLWGFLIRLAATKKVIFPATTWGEAVTTVKAMFNECAALEEIKNLDLLNTAKITNMSYMFDGCTALASLDLSKWNTERVTDMASMFNNCTSLTTLTLPANFVTTRTKNLWRLFRNCWKLDSIDCTYWNTTNVTNMSEMFSDYHQRSLLAVIFGDFSTRNVTDMSNMFDGCISLVSHPAEGFVTLNVEDMGSMFRYCSSLTSLNLSNWTTEKVTNMASMFKGCTALKTLNLSSFNQKNTFYVGDMFADCTNLENVTFPAEGLMCNYSNVKSLDLRSCPLTVDSIKSLVTALATKTSACTLYLKTSAWNAAKAADSTLETTLTTKNWAVTTID